MRYIISILLLTLTPFIIHAQSIISSPDYGCDSIDVAFHYSDSANATNYNWDFDNGETSANAAEVVTFDTIGSYYIKLVVDGSLTFWDTIVVRPQPSAKFRYSDSMAIGSYAIEFFKPEPKDSLFNYTYSWIFRDGSTILDSLTDSIPSVEYTFSKEGTYNVTLRVTDGLTCNNSWKDTVSVYDTLDVPNVFTPNDDNINDVWVVKSNGYTAFNVKIFDASGTMVYEKEAPVILWDGRTLNGNTLQPGIYYYVLKPIQDGQPDRERSGFLYMYK